MLKRPEIATADNGSAGVLTRSRRYNLPVAFRSACTALLATCFWAILSAFTVTAGASANNVPSPTAGEAPGEIPLNCPAQFITAMVSDGHGGVWVAGEDTGIYRGTLNVQSVNANKQTGEPPGLSQ